MTTFYAVISWVALFSYWLLIASVTVRILMKRRTVPSAMAWLLIIYILPLLGIVAYLLFGELHLGTRRAERARAMWPFAEDWLKLLKTHDELVSQQSSSVAEAIFSLCEHRQGVAGIKGNQLQLFNHTDQAMRGIIADIEQAQSSIEMVFYIWNPGGMADEVALALMAAAQRGIRCRLMVDSAGSVRFFRSPWPERLQRSGVQVVEALSVSLLRVFLRRMDLRQHRKIVIIDNRITWTGSMNMVDPRYFKQNKGLGQWIDLMARMEGPATTMVGIIYACDWEIETGERLLPPEPDVAQFPWVDQEEHIVQVIASGPGYPEEMIHQALLTAIYAARKTLVLTTPYFVPSDDLLHAICTAAQRGVAVTIILPQRNDSLLVSWASRAFFAELLEAGVKVVLFNGGMLHTKSVLVDDQLSLIGTVNLDMRSLWLNFEITLVIDDKTFAAALAKEHNAYLEQSIAIQYDNWRTRPLWQRMLERLFYFFSPLL